MREIKFRAWDERHEVMHHNVQFIKSGDTGADWICFDSDEKPSKRNATGILFDDPFFSQQIKLMQYTGLKDKNGREIYEGDILSSEYPMKGNKNCHPVVWGSGRWNVDHSINDCCRAWRGDLNGHHASEEVIGNIYENPELLK